MLAWHLNFVLLYDSGFLCTFVDSKRVSCLYGAFPARVTDFSGQSFSTISGPRFNDPNVVELVLSRLHYDSDII